MIIFFYINPDQVFGSYMETVNFKNHIQLKEFDIPFAEDDYCVLLFEPFHNGLITQTQYYGGNREDVGHNEFTAY
ncbi:hypothetical protein KJ782_04045 [Patescibacteria group bacterium]|nr:hypothetical protein [Patescibacteria group bacterium]